jgi:hypothetical protein
VRIFPRVDVGFSKCQKIGRGENVVGQVFSQST